jgi:hypothetical protein
VSNGDDFDHPGVVVDPVQHTVRTSPGRPAGGEWWLQRLAHPTRVIEERAGHELEHGDGDTLRQEFLERTGGGTGDAEAVP